jgi:beta-glucosidase
VKGFQGDDLASNSTIAACAKHYAAYGAAEGGRDYNTTDMSERTLREVYLPPFKAAADEGVATFMTSFNEINGVPSSGNELLHHILRMEWDFKGMVVSDWNAVGELIPHGIAKDKKEAAVLAIRAGVDMDMQVYVYS